MLLEQKRYFCIPNFKHPRSWEKNKIYYNENCFSSLEPHQTLLLSSWRDKWSSVRMWDPFVWISREMRSPCVQTSRETNTLDLFRVEADPILGFQSVYLKQFWVAVLQWVAGAPDITNLPWTTRNTPTVEQTPMTLVLTNYSRSQNCLGERRKCLCSSFQVLFELVEESRRGEN